MNIPIFKIPNIQEFLAVKNDIKLVMRQGLRKEFIEFVKKKAEKEKMCILIKNIDIRRLENKSCIHHQKNLVAYISKSKDMAEQAYRAEKKNDIMRLGRLLGYPKCCVEFYQHGIPQPTGDGFSFILYTLSNTHGKPSFYTNNIFNYQTRVPTKHKLEIFNSFKGMLGRTEKHFLISHVPCSYRCKESIGIGKEVLKLVENENKKFARDIVSDLKKIFLVINDFNWVSFDGKLKGNSIHYLKSKPFLSDYPGENFIKGNKVIAKRDRIKILKDGNLLHEIKNLDKNARILDFS